MSALSKLIPSYLKFKINFSNDAVQCLEIRTREEHKYSEAMKVKLVHYNARRQRYYWGASERYGFHCFHDFEENGRCDDFEYRIFTDC